MIVSTISEKVDKSDVESISSETIKDESGLSLSRAYSVTSEPPVSIPFRCVFIPYNKEFDVLIIEFLKNTGVQKANIFICPHCPIDRHHSRGCCAHFGHGHRSCRLPANETQQ